MKERLKEFMQKRGLNARQLSEAIGVQASSISHVLKGRNLPSVDFLIKLLEVYSDADINYLLTGRYSVSPHVREAVEMPISDEDVENRTEKKDVTNEPDSKGRISEVIVLQSDGTFRYFKEEKSADE